VIYGHAMHVNACPGMAVGPRFGICVKALESMLQTHQMLWFDT
jgi:hypothetical protein